MENGELFPFLHSTDIFPEFAFGMLPHIHRDVAEEVQAALFSLDDYASAAEGLETCYQELNGNECDSLPFPEAFAVETNCGTTKELAWTALNASRAANVAGFRPSRSYFSVRTMQQAGGFLVKDDNGDWSCTRSDNMYDGITCPEGYTKVDSKTYYKLCDGQGLQCKDGYDCFCNPCTLEVDVYTVNDDFMVDGECSKEQLCTTTEQRKTAKFRAYDNVNRDLIKVRAVMLVEGQTLEIPVNNVNGTYAYDFSISHNKVGTADVFVYVNDVPLPIAPFKVHFQPRNCEKDFEGESRKPAEDGSCICREGDLEISGKCLPSVVIFSLIASIVILIGIVAASFYLRHKKRLSDQMWHINAEELHFNEPLDIIGQGAFGEVILAEYRGTKVAIKRVIKKPADRLSSKGASSKLKGGTSFDNTPTPSVDDFQGSEISQYQPQNEKDPALSGSIDLEAGRSKSFAAGAVDLELLAQLSFSRQNGKWAQFCPGGLNEDDHYRIKSNIFGGSTAGGMNSSSVAAQLLCCFDKQRQRKNEFVLEMRLLSRLRHPCITTVMGAVISPFHDPMLVLEYMEFGR